MTMTLTHGLVALTLLFTALPANAQEATGTLASVDLEVPRPPDVDLDESQQLRIRYKRTRIVGGTLLGAATLAIPVSAVVAAVRYDCDPDEEWFCGLSSPAFVTSWVTALVSPALVAGGITLGIGVRRGRRVRLDTPSLAAGRDGLSARIGGHF